MTKNTLRITEKENGQENWTQFKMTKVYKKHLPDKFFTGRCLSLIMINLNLYFYFQIQTFYHIVQVGYNDKSKSLFLFSNSNFLSYCASGKVPSFT